MTFLSEVPWWAWLLLLAHVVVGWHLYLAQRASLAVGVAPHRWYGRPAVIGAAWALIAFGWVLVIVRVWFSGKQPRVF